MNVRVLLHLLIVPLIIAEYGINSDLGFFPIVQESKLGNDSLQIVDPCAILFKTTNHSGQYSHI